MIEFFIKQHKSVNLVFLFVIAVGINYFINGQKETFPKIGLDFISITTAYPGASADEIEKLITDKIENAIDGVEGRKNYYSTSSEGISSIFFEVDPDSNKTVEEVTDDIEAEIDAIIGELPSDLEQDPIVNEISFGSSEAVISVVFSGKDGDDVEKIKKIIRDFEDDVKKVEGVGRTSKEDYPKTQIWIKANGDLLTKNNIEFQEIVSSVASGNISLPAGSIKNDGEETLIRTSKEYNDLAEIKNRILRSNDSGKDIRVKDVAEVEINYEELSSYSRIQGKDAYRLSVFQTDNGDIIRISSGVKKIIEKYKKEYSDVDIFYVNDVSFYVERRLRILAQNASIGLVLVFLCLILFFNFRITFWTTMGIPFSFCLSIIICYSLGITLNLMSMFGFIIVIGMIVDDAIIVSENIYRRKELGEPLVSAAINGTKEMFVSIMAVTATTIVAFYPLSTLPDIFGKVLGILPQVVIITMLASFIECLFILPGHIANTKDKQGVPSEKKKGSRRWFFKVRKSYGRIIEKLVFHPKKTFALFLIGSFLIVFLIMQRLPFVLFPENAERISVKVETKISNGLEKTEKIIDEIEITAMENLRDGFRESVSVIGLIRQNNTSSKRRSYVGTVNLTINPDSPKTAGELTGELEELLKDVEGVEKLEVSVVVGGPPQGNPVQIDIFGNSNKEIKLVADELKEIVKKIPNTRSVQTSYEEGKKEINLEIDEERASLLGINTRNIAGVVRTAFDGNKVTTLNSFAKFEEEVEVVVKYNDELTQNIDDINNLRVKNAYGERIPIKNFANVKFENSSGKIEKENGSIILSVTGQLEDPQNKEYNSKSINDNFRKTVIPEFKKKYPNLEFKLAGEEEESNKLQRGAIIALLLALAGVFFILTSIFKSYIQPFVIMSIIPFSIIGVLIGLFVNGVPLGMMPMLGVVALIGVIVNDSLVMINFINRLRSGGMEKKMAIIEGSKTRLRPILMTSITTIVGLFPLSYGIGGREPFLEPMALSFLWGIMFGTVILIFILPIIYLIVDDIISFIYKKVFKKEYVIKVGNPIHLNENEKINAV